MQKTFTVRTSKSADAPAKRGTNAYIIFGAECREKHNLAGRYDDFDAKEKFAKVNKFISAKWAKLSDAQKAPYERKAAAANEKKAAKPAKGEVSVIVSPDGKGHTKFFDEICKALELHFVHKKTLRQSDMKLIKIKHIENLLTLIKRVTNQAKTVAADWSDYSDATDSFYTDDDSSEDDSDSDEEKPKKKKKGGCTNSQQIAQLDFMHKVK